MAGISPGGAFEHAVIGTLCKALGSRFERRGALADLDESISLLSRVVGEDLPPRTRTRWSTPHSPACPASSGQAAKGISASRGLDRPSQENLLSRTRMAGMDAAACAVQAGSAARAVEFVDQGRAVLWAQLLEARTDVSALRDVRSDLALRPERVRGLLDRPETADGTGIASA
ncbi:MAG TPA: hypothetical protein VGX23_12040 [Actinocrinis sp.]|nr:hypothetical protein [Actinocrinis sp.]